MRSLTEEDPDAAVRSHWLAWALELMLVDRLPDASPVTLELQTGDRPIVLETRDGAVRTRLGPADAADATIAGPPRPILGLLLGVLEFDDARASGVDYRGDQTVVGRLGPV